MPVILLLLVTTLALAAEIPPAPSKLQWDGFKDHVFVSGDLFLSGQPLTPAAMQQVAASGIKTIVNLRTPAEIADKDKTPIDEAILADELGIQYIQLPSGGDDHPYTPGTVKQLANILANETGSVLLHCGSGRRATHLWVAYLIDHEDIDPDVAISLGKQANFGTTPFEQYLEGELHYSK